MRQAISAFVLAVLAPVIHAQDGTPLYDIGDAPRAAENTWEGAAEFGLVSTSGNSETSTTNGSLDLIHEREKWRHRGRLSALRTEEQQTVTAERYTAAFKSDYKFRPYDYLYGALRYEQDEFSGYDYRYSEAVGYGRKVLHTESLRFDLEIGAGARQEKPIGESQSDEAIVRFAGDLRWRFAPTAAVSQTLLVESDSNTYVESETGLKADVIGNLAMKLSYSVRHNSEVPADQENTDTITSVNIVYTL